MTVHSPDLLLVEDCSSDIDLTLAGLGGAATRMFVARDGAMALDYVFGLGAYADREDHSLPKAILLDLWLPKVSGLEVLRRVKSDDRTKHIPIVVLTPLDEEAHVTDSYRLGANSCVVKPLEAADFVRAIEQVAHYWTSLNEPGRRTEPRSGGGQGHDGL